MLLKVFHVISAKDETLSTLSGSCFADQQNKAPGRDFEYDRCQMLTCVCMRSLKGMNECSHRRYCEQKTKKKNCFASNARITQLEKLLKNCPET